MPNPTTVECPDCGGNCEPECGRHPRGCLFAGVQPGYWQIAPGCRLEHRDVERMKAWALLDSFPRMKVLRAYES